MSNPMTIPVCNFQKYDTVLRRPRQTLLQKNELKKSHGKPELVGMFILLELGGRAKKTSSVRMDCIT